MTDGHEIGGVLLEPQPLTRRPLLSVLLFSAMRTNLTRAGTLQQGLQVDEKHFSLEKLEIFKCFITVGIKIMTSNGVFLKAFYIKNIIAQLYWNSRWPFVQLLATFQHSAKKIMIIVLKKQWLFTIFIPSWAGKDVAPVPPGDGSSSVSAVEISDWPMLPFVSLQYTSGGLLLEFEEFFGVHSSPGCFFWISVEGDMRVWVEESRYVCAANLTSTSSMIMKDRSVEDCVRKSLRQKKCL